MDRLEQIINDYKNNRITIDDVEKYMAFLTFEEDKKYYKSCEKLRDRMDVYYNNTEEVYFEKLRYMSIEKILNMMFRDRIINQREFDILFKWCIDMKTQEEIAEEYNISNQYVSKIIQNTQKRVGKIIKKYTIYGDAFNELFESLLLKAKTNIPGKKIRDAHAPKHKIAYPSEYFQKVNVGGEWRKDKLGRDYYKSKTKCIIPEYLRECFIDENTKCSQCYTDEGDNKCSRREVN